MSRNKKYRSLPGHLKKQKSGLDRLQKSHFIGRHRVVMLDDRIEVLNSANVSTTAWTDLDVSGDVSEKSIAAILLCKIRDTGSAATQIVLQLRAKGSATSDGTFNLNGSHINDEYNGAQAIVGLDDDYTLQYAYTASGSGTLDVLIYLIGYVEQL